MELTITEQKIIILNSKDAIKLNGEYLSYVSFNFRDILKRDEDIYYTSIAVLSAEIPFSFYTVNENNNTLNYTINSIDYILVLNEGNYNATTFITEFVSKFNAGGHDCTITMAFNKIIGKLTTIKTSGAYDIIYKSSPIYEVLGLLSNTSYTLSTSIEHPHMLNLLGIKKLRILSSSLSLENYDSSGHTSSNLLQTISVDKPAYSLLTFQNTSNALSRLKNKILNEIEIQIRDENNNLVDFNNVYWTISLVLNVHRKINPPVDETINLNNLAINPIPTVNENNPIPTKIELREILEKIDEDNLRELEFLMT